jgi:hypothetical protein
MILGYDWLRAHGLARLFFTTPTLSACAPIGAVRRAAASASISRQQPRQRARRRAPSALCLSPGDATALLRLEVLQPPAPGQARALDAAWGGRPGAVAAAAFAAAAKEDTPALAGELRVVHEGGVHLGELLVGHVTFAAGGGPGLHLAAGHG